MTYDQDAAHLLDELRRDTELDDELEVEALTRVRRLLLVRAVATGQASNDDAPLPRALSPGRRFGPRAGLLMALAAGTALGAAGHAVVTFVALPATTTPVKNATPAPSRPAAPRAPAGPAARASTPPVPSASASASASANAQAPLRTRIPNEPAAPSAAPALAASITPTRGFDAELRELERARHAVATGQPEQALQALRLHAQDHPTGVLTQEREALMVRAFVAAGHFAEARAAGERFLARYPESTLRASVERALESIP